MFDWRCRWREGGKFDGRWGRWLWSEMHRLKRLPHRTLIQNETSDRPHGPLWGAGLKAALLPRLRWNSKADYHFLLQYSVPPYFLLLYLLSSYGFT